MTTAPTDGRPPAAQHGEQETPADADPDGGAPGGGPGTDPRAGPRRRWWREVLLIAAFYAVYTAIRDLRGTKPVSASVAYANALRIIRWERSVGIFHEARFQHWVLHARLVVQILDVWYGSAHFLVTAAVLLVLFFAYPARYRRWRNTLAAATALAMIGFAWFPLLPPRLLPATYGFVDTLRSVGGLWAFNSGPMPRLTDQFAAMPSLHFAWALWCGVALIAVLPRWWAKVLAGLYPTVTLVCVVATGNHYFADAIAGAVVVVAGWVIAWAADLGLRRLGLRRHRPPAPSAPVEG